MKQPRNQDNNLVHRSVTMQAQFEGPLPDPVSFEKYNKILPGVADRIVIMAESEVSHRHYIEKKAVDSASRDGLLGLFFGFGIGIFTVGVGAYVVLQGQPFAGSFISGSGVAGLVGVFVYGSRTKSK